MDYTQDKQQSELSQLEWSSAYFTVSEFLKKFPLPQLVKVAGGFYGDDEESTLIDNQILCLHSFKPMEKVRGREGSGREISILVECKNKVEVRPANCKDVYENVEELCTAFPRYVRVSQGYYSPSKEEDIIKVGDKLHLKSIDKSKKGEEKLTCVNQNGQTIELPKDCTAGFRPLTDGKEYYLSQVIKKFPMPVYVQFVDPFNTGVEAPPSEDNSFCEPLGTICLQRVFTETVVTATSIRDDGRQSIVTFSPGVNINLIVCEDMLRNSTDYAELCQSFQDIDFQSISPDIYEYVDVAQIMKEVALDVSSKTASSAKRLKLPHLKKLGTKSSTTKHDTKIGGKLTSFLRRHSERKTSPPSKTVQNDKSETQPIYAEPTNIHDEIEPKSTECNTETIYTELDPTYISTTSQEYEKPLKQLNQANPVIPAVSSSKKQPANFSPPSGKLLPISRSNRLDGSGSKSLSHGSRNPPTVLKKPSSRPDNSTASRDSPQAVGTRPQIPDTPPQLPIRPAAPDKKPAVRDKKPAAPDKKPTASDKKPAAPDKKPTLPGRKTATPDQLHPVSESPTTHDSKTVSPASPAQLPDRSIVPDNMPALPTSLSARPASLPISEKPAITPELQKDEIHEAIEKYPSDLSSLSVADVSKLLKYLGMESDIGIFQAELVDGEMLASMDRESLESLNIKAFHVKKLLKFIGGWRPNV